MSINGTGMFLAGAMRKLFCLFLLGYAFSGFTPSFATDALVPGEKDKVKLANQWLNISYEIKPEFSVAEAERLIYQHRFDELEIRLKKVEKEFDSNIQYEMKLLNAYEVFGDLAARDNPNISNDFDRWIAEKQSYIAYAAKGFYWAGVAGKFRGTEFVAKTPAFNMNMATQFAQKAIENLNQANRLYGSDYFPALDGLVVEHMVFGDRDSANQAMAKALLLRPNAYYIRFNYMNYLEPKWGGDYQTMQAFIDMSQQFGSQNPRIWSLRGAPFASQAYGLVLDKKYSAAATKYQKALQYGDKPNWIVWLAYCQYKTKKPMDSIVTLKRLLAYSIDEEMKVNVLSVIEALRQGNTLSWENFDSLG